MSRKTKLKKFKATTPTQISKLINESTPRGKMNRKLEQYSGHLSELEPPDHFEDITKILDRFKPQTESQQKLVEIINNNIVSIGAGAAGTGKSYVALHTVISTLIKHSDIYEKLIIFHPIVQVDDDDLGFLPGGIDEKINPYKAASLYTIQKITTKTYMDTLIRQRSIEFLPINYIRGMTFDNTILLLEEAQNTSMSQMKTLLTRIGKNCKFVIIGDLKQSDKFGQPGDKNQSGLSDALYRLEGVKDVGTMSFKPSDVVRSEIVKAILERYEE